MKIRCLLILIFSFYRLLRNCLNGNIIFYHLCLVALILKLQRDWRHRPETIVFSTQQHAIHGRCLWNSVLLFLNIRWTSSFLLTIRAFHSATHCQAIKIDKYVIICDADRFLDRFIRCLECACVDLILSPNCRLFYDVSMASIGPSSACGAYQSTGGV